MERCLLDVGGGVPIAKQGNQSDREASCKVPAEVAAADVPMGRRIPCD